MADQINDYFKFREEYFDVSSLADNDGFIEFLNRPEVVDAINENRFFHAFSLASKYGYIRSLMVVLLKVGINPLLSEKVLIREAFESSKYLKEIVIPENIEVIGAHAFQNSWVNAIYIPKSVEFIRQQAFADMHKEAGDIIIEYDGSAGDWNDIEFDRDVFQNSRGTIYCKLTLENIEFGD